MPQTILIVGGTEGIGFEVAKAIRTQPDALKTNRVIFGLVEPVKIERSATYFIGDVTNSEVRERAVRYCIDKFGGIDTLVYSAGVITPIERIENLDMEAVKRTFDVNVFGAMAMVQLCLPYLRESRISNPLNAAHGKIIILTSACDSAVTYHGWTPYCTTKAALTRFISCLAHEERLICIQGVYPKLTRTKMPKDVIAGKYEGVMADHEIERFKIWDEVGDEMVEPPEWCGEAVAKLALGLFEGGKSGETLYYDEHVPKKITGT
ncbi:NAD(P)-binding protein [Cucurbitaria berberidis CBS 394.84]|uniref:NAD(P)-binding protein n=1 Tax=Cucurbitaria berberidis CBS 394.84 TaxID=1168544 RepID=A0A9P4GHW4_9PLEO|nr:NAD(P)-binding protein [Cucurbitaria berberidis CBS 394.84]KAF1846463.1 NAD(P)-binding protein [Cucurbitaria berberidis CBS 394.84]